MKAKLGIVKPGGGVPRYQLKITLARSKPPIWRRVAVPVTLRLDRLHNVIQFAMDWFDCHLHEFRVGPDVYGRPDPDFGRQLLDESRYTLQDIAPETRQRFVYEYDFGDGWQHDILVEKLLPPDPVFKHPLCLGGKNACPPEDCGGIYGYYNFLEALKNPKHEEHESMTDWIGRDWDAHAFDLAAVNMRLRAIKV